MATKDFLKDRLILFLGFLTTVLTAINIFSVLLRIDFNQSQLISRHWLINGHSQFLSGWS